MPTNFAPAPDPHARAGWIRRRHPSYAERGDRTVTEIYAVLSILVLLFRIFMLTFKKAWQGVIAYVATVLV